MRIIIAGGTGFLGTHLSNALIAGGHDVVVLTRRTGGSGATPGVSYATWQPESGTADLTPALSGADAIVNLAGDSIASGRWTAAKKQRLRDSRVNTTRLLIEAARRLPSPPRVWVNGSAVGYYGSRGDEQLTEASGHGSDFLSAVAVDWEAAAAAASQFARLVIIRSGIVLDRHGGALPRMLLPFRMFVGGPIGSGQRYHVVDSPGRLGCARGLGTRARRVRSVQCDEPATGDQCRVQPHTRQRPPATELHANPGVRTSPSAWRDGRRVVAFEPTCTARTSRSPWIRVRVSRSRSRVAIGGGMKTID